MREQYEAQAIKVCGLEPEGWYFCLGRRALTEREFDDAYQLETGVRLLPSEAQSHSTGLTVAGGVSLAAGGLLGLYGLGMVMTNAAADHGDPKTSGGTVVSTLAFSGLFLGLGAVFLYGSSTTTPSKGLASDHVLTLAEGRKYADTYDRAVLQRLLRQRERPQASIRNLRTPTRTTLPVSPSWRVAPSIGPAGIGLAGSF